MFLGAIGPKGLYNMANLSFQRAHYFQEKLEDIGYKLKYSKPFFHEFVTYTPIPAVIVEKHLAQYNILAGQILSENEILWCVTEMVSEETIDQVIKHLKEVKV